MKEKNFKHYKNLYKRTKAISDIYEQALVDIKKRIENTNAEIRQYFHDNRLKVLKKEKLQKKVIN